MGALEGRVAIITGAGRGIGRQHALLFAREGAKVVVNDLGGAMDGTGDDRTPAQQVVEEIRAMGGEAVANGDNVSDWEGGQRLVNQAIETFGDLHVLVNNAGILRDRVLVNMTEEEWDIVIQVHLKGHFVPSRWAAAYWREQTKAGRTVNASIINASSTSGLLGNPGQANYGAAKAGIAALSTVLARDLERIGVRVNTITPTAATRLLGTVMQPKKDQDPNAFDPYAPAHIAPLAVWLCSDLSRDVNGQVFAVSGARIQLVRGYHPVTELDSGEQPWSPDRIERMREELLGKGRFDTGIPPFLPPVGWE